MGVRGRSPRSGRSPEDCCTGSEAYQQVRKRPPGLIVVHKKSRYTAEERTGFRQALKGKVAEYDLVALSQTSRFRLVRAGRYPP